jgi:4'-phosphopantetheinyl transferase
VHLWWRSLNLSDPVSDALVGETLSPDEHERAARFYFARDRRQFVLARGMLRAILALYVGRRPQEIRFQLFMGRCASGPPRAMKMGLSVLY